MIVEPDIRDHYKTEQLARALGIDGDAVVVLLIRMWGYCQRRKSPELPADPLALASICRYPANKRATKRDADRLRSGLLSTKWLDEHGEDLVAHGWAERNRKWLTRSTIAANQRRQGGRFTTVDGAVDGASTGREEKRREENTPIVPSDGSSPNGHPEPDSPVPGNLDSEKKRMCALLGVDPSRPLSYEAEHEIARISPIPADEWAAVEWLHRQPDEQRRPRPRMTVGSLAANWQDEVAKARAYAELVGAQVTQKSAKKKEGPPSGWTAFLQAQGFPACDWSDAERSLRTEFHTWLSTHKTQ